MAVFIRELVHAWRRRRGDGRKYLLFTAHLLRARHRLALLGISSLDCGFSLPFHLGIAAGHPGLTPR